MPAPAPHPTANVPPLPGTLEEGSVSVINLDKKGKGVEKDSEVMQVKKARINEDSIPMANDDEAEGHKDKGRGRKEHLNLKERLRLKTFH